MITDNVRRIQDWISPNGEKILRRSCYVFRPNLLYGFMANHFQASILRARYASKQDGERLHAFLDQARNTVQNGTQPIIGGKWHRLINEDQYNNLPWLPKYVTLCTSHGPWIEAAAMYKDWKCYAMPADPAIQPAEGISGILIFARFCTDSPDPHIAAWQPYQLRTRKPAKTTLIELNKLWSPLDVLVCERNNAAQMEQTNNHLSRPASHYN